MILSKNDYVPPKIENNPGVGIEGKCAFTNGNDTWEEKFNLLDNLKNVFDNNKIKFELVGEYLLVNDIFFKPEIVGIQPQENKDVQTTTVISYFNQQFVSSGSFEFQHSIGKNINESTVEGFNNWFSADFPVIIESMSEKLKQCTMMKLNFKNKSSRKIYLGPVIHLVKKVDDKKEEHPFCQCCFVSNNFKNFEEYLTNSGFYAIRMLALRDKDGQINADCRINGIDYELGKQSLIEYAKTWPNHGVEMRKQYVIVKDA